MFLATKAVGRRGKALQLTPLSPNSTGLPRLIDESKTFGAPGNGIQRAGTPPVNARRLWKGRSIFSRATENGPDFCECFVCAQRSAGNHMGVPHLRTWSAAALSFRAMV